MNPTWKAVLLGLALATLGSCGAQEPEVSRITMPQGNGGADVSNNITTWEAANAQGQAYASLGYDSSYWSPLYVQDGAEDDVFLVLSNASGSVTITLLRTLGRADTTCRYQMAMAARDEGYAIGDYNWQTNPHEVEFFFGEVTKEQGGRAYYCAQVWKNFGVEVLISAEQASHLDNNQVLYLVRSLEALR